MENNKHELNETFNEKGETISPVLPKEIKNFLIDIDGTICDDVPNEEPERMSTCLPYPDALKILNKWHSEGHIITFFTSRTGISLVVEIITGSITTLSKRLASKGSLQT